MIPAHYRLIETSTTDYLTRTEANVIDSDATLVFTAGPAKTGSLRTIKFAMQHGKPWHHVDLLLCTSQQAVRDILAWLDGNGPGELDPNTVTIIVPGRSSNPKPCYPIIHENGPGPGWRYSRGNSFPKIELDAVPRFRGIVGTQSVATAKFYQMFC